MSIQVLPGGHCMYCHKDYEEKHEDHPCFNKAVTQARLVMPTQCGPECENSKYRMPKFSTNDTVRKVGGDYTFEGSVRAVFQKKSGKYRVVVEDDRGILHIFSEANLERLSPGCQQ